MTLGRINTIESAGMLDGPGVRTVVFMQGCNLRCIYCHNPDTWIKEEGYSIEADSLVNKILRYKYYFNKSKGGVTFSGGEPLLQPEFLTEVLKKCKSNGIHTVVDTAGFGLGNYEEILRYTDLVILDIKHIDNKGYKYITGKDMEYFNEFVKTVKKSGNKLWIRHVLVPGETDSIEHISKLAEIINGMDNFKNIEKIELLPYHTLGLEKYEKLGIPYKLNGLESMDNSKAKTLENLLIEKIKFHNQHYVNFI